MNREQGISPTATATIIIIGSSFAVLLLSFLFFVNLTTDAVGGIEREVKSYKNSLLNHFQIFAQAQAQSQQEVGREGGENNKPPVIKNAKIIDFTGVNYADVVNSRDINLNSFTVSAWFKTNMNVTGRDVAFLINKGGFGTDRPGFNLNYGIWLNNREQISGGFEATNGDDYFLISQASYADGIWHNAILTFDDKQHMLNLYADGLQVVTNTTNIGITPDTTGKQPVRLGANSFETTGQPINGNYTGQLDDIQVYDYAFTKEQVASLFDTESKIAR